jgi:hypothetical protein
MKVRLPLIPFAVHFSVERRPRKRATVLTLMIVIAVLALAMGVVRIYNRCSNDWAYDRQAAAEHRHESDFSMQMLNAIRNYQSQQLSTDKKCWLIHGIYYWVTPELEHFLTAKVAYHLRQAQRHERAIGRWWMNVTRESPPTPPPVVPFDEAMGES